MNHEEIAELLGAYALDAVDGDERDLVEEHLAVCPRCRAEVNEHREVATMLAHTGAAAPEGVWHRIADSLEEPAPDLRLVAAGSPSSRPPGRRLPPVAVALLAAAAVVMVALGLQVRDQDQRIDRLQTAMEDPLLPTFQAALEDPDSEVVELVSADGRIRLRGAVTDDGVGYLRATALPALDEGRTYQLWGAAGDQLISLAVLGPDPGVVSFPARPYEAFAVTEEDAPGVVVSSNPPVAAGTTV